jgi:hypothetical protein
MEQQERDLAQRLRSVNVVIQAALHTVFTSTDLTFDGLLSCVLGKRSEHVSDPHVNKDATNPTCVYSFLLFLTSSSFSLTINELGRHGIRYRKLRKVTQPSVAYLSDRSSEQIFSTSWTRLCTFIFRYSRMRCVFTVCLEMPRAPAMSSSHLSSNTSFAMSNSRSDRLNTCVAIDQSSAESAARPGGKLSDAVERCRRFCVRITHPLA